VKRVDATWALVALALVLGIATAALAAENRARADELDTLERWCEAQSRRNELQRVENEKAEWRLAGQKPGPAASEVKP
jgi:antibiotic biosynthesis monooxygenase (ABM) superfamily enzyme